MIRRVPTDAMPGEFRVFCVLGGLSPLRNPVGFWGSAAFPASRAVDFQSVCTLGALRRGAKRIHVNCAV